MIIHNIGSDSPETLQFKILTSSDPNDFMHDNNEPAQASTTDQPSCSYSPPMEQRPHGTMKSTPRMDRIVTNIWKQPNPEEVTTIDDSSNEDFPQPPIKNIEVVYPDSSENTPTIDNTNVDANEDVPIEAQEADLPVNDEDHTTATTSLAKSSISTIHASDFYNQDDFMYLKFLNDGGVW